MDTMQEEMLRSLCRAYDVPCSAEQVASLYVSHSWLTLPEGDEPLRFVDVARDPTVVRVKYRDRDNPLVLLTAEKRDGRWRETGLDYLPAAEVTAGVPGERLRLSGSPVRLPNEIDGLRALPGGGWELPPEVPAFMIKPQDTTEYWREKAREYLAAGVPNHAPPNACPHCGHATPPGPRCAVCRRYLD